MTFPVRANDWASYAAAEQRARDLTWTPGEFDGAERIFPLADPVLPGAEEGRLAARRAKARGTVGEVRVASGKASGTAVCGGYEVRELATGFRPFARGIPRVEAPESDLKVLGEYDTVVVGGGTSGAPAAIAAGRAGARTLLVEYVYGLGGVSTVGQIGKYWYGNRCGFTAEVEAGVKGMHALVYNLAKGEWMRRECRKAGVEIWFGTAGTGAVLKDGRVAGVVVATPCGSGVVLAKNVIDATGNADIAAALEAALARPGVAGYSASAVAELPPGGGYCPKPETDLCQRELGLARALVACGDPHGKGREIFARYAQDPRGVFALYARRILARLNF